MEGSCLTSDWETTEPPLLLQGLHLSDSGVTAEDDRIEDKAVLETLDLLDHLGLRICRAVVVNNTKTSLQCHMCSHLVFRYGIHR